MGIVWVRTSVERAVGPGVAVAGNWDIEAWRYWNETHRIGLGSYAIAGKPNTVDDPWPNTPPATQNMWPDGCRPGARFDRD